MATEVHTPTRLTGDNTTDIRAINEFAWKFYRAFVLQARVIDRLDAIAAVPPLDGVVSDPPTQAQVLAISNKINALIAAAQ